jgi:FkbM family methyltransferase
MLKFMRRTVRKIILELFRTLIAALLKTKSGRALLFLSQPPNTLLVTGGADEKYIVNSSDQAIGRYTFRENLAYEFETLETVLSLLPVQHTRETLIDIGANIGTVGIHAIANGLFERCIAFEPDPNNFRLLSANIALNSLGNKIRALNFALSEKSGEELEFELSDDNYGDHRVRISSKNGTYNENSRKVIWVATKCLDDYASEIAPANSLIWMDTQGFEGYVLSGAKSILQSSVPIVTEFWPYGMIRSNSFEKFLAAIEIGNYSTVIDLKKPNTKICCDRQAFVDIANYLGDDGDYTDLLIY